MADPIGSVTGSLASPAKISPSEAVPTASTTDAQHFAALVAPLHADPVKHLPPADASDLRLAVPHSGTGGDEILNSLQRFSQAVQDIGKLGAHAPTTQLHPGPAASPVGAPANAPDQQLPASNAVDELQHMFSDGMAAQAKMYGAVFNLGLVQSSGESVNKSLKSLITQGGG